MDDDVKAQDQKKQWDPSCFHLCVIGHLCKNWQRRRQRFLFVFLFSFFWDFYPNNTFSSRSLALSLSRALSRSFSGFSFIYLRFVRWLTRREWEKKSRQYVRRHTLTRERRKVERMNEETYEDDDDDDDNNNNNKNTLQFLPPAIIWSILVDYIVDSGILLFSLLFFFFSSSFLSTYYSTSTKWRTSSSTRTTTINNIILLLPRRLLVLLCFISINRALHMDVRSQLLTAYQRNVVALFISSQIHFRPPDYLSAEDEEERKKSMSSIWNCYSFFAYRLSQKVCACVCVCAYGTSLGKIAWLFHHWNLVRLIE